MTNSNKVWALSKKPRGTCFEPELAVDLQADSALPRDFLRPARRSGKRISQAIDPVVAHTRNDHLLASLAVLVARHARSQLVAVTLHHSGRRLVATLDVADAQPFANVVSAAAQALRTLDEAPVSASGPIVMGVLLHLGEVLDAVPAADLAILHQAHTIEADADLYRPSSLPPLVRHLTHLLKTTNPKSATAVGDLTICDHTEHERVRRVFNALRLQVPAEATVESLIIDQARRHPARVCAVHGDDSLSFGALDAASNRLANLLIECEVGPGHFVGLLDHRGLDFLVAMVAIWKAGAAYVPMDPDYPEERLRYMLADSDAVVAIVGREALSRFTPALTRCPSLRNVVCLQAATAPEAFFTLHNPEAIAARDDAPVPRRAGPRDPAYMVYTSGSTGRPKGAIVRHDGAVNHLFAQAHALGEATISRFLQSAPSSSDISVWQFAAPLAFGGTTVVVDDATDVARVLAEVRLHGLHLIELVPSVMKYLVDYASALDTAERALPTLRYAMVTGESTSVALVNAWLALYPEIPIVNAYGPTEAADDIAQAVIDRPLPPRLASVPIGRPLANLDLHVLDDRLRLMPVGVLGEICVAGIGVGNGYWRQPVKTADAFVTNPFADRPDAAGTTLYRTGDLGRWSDDGTLEYAGRVDLQVQLRGQRIELPEIEAVLREHPGVVDAVANVFHDDHGGDGRLVAFVVPRAPSLADDASWRSHLAARLPACMLPTAIVQLAKLPLNPAGKVDRRALKPPDLPVRERSTPLRPPRNEVEAVLARLWTEELGAGSVGIDDDFFALGGDSMSALALAVAAREAGWEMRSADLLAHPTIERLASVLRPVLPDCSINRGVAPDGSLAMRPLAKDQRISFLAANPNWADAQVLTPAQHSLFVHWLMARDKRAYVDQLCYEFEGDLDLDAFTRAWETVVELHASLRAGFLRSALPQPVQVTAQSMRVPIQIVDLGALDRLGQHTAWRELCDREVDTGFDLARPPLMRLQLARLAPRRYALAWTHHHLLLDGWSVTAVLAEVMALLDLASGGSPAPLAKPLDDAQYREYLAQLNLAPGFGYWQRTLAGVGLAPDWAMAAPAQAIPGYQQTNLMLTESISAALSATAVQLGVTISTLLQAAWAVLLARHTGRSDTVFGVVSSGRELPLPQMDALVGMFVVTQPLRIDTAPDNSLAGWLADVQQRAAEARQHEAVPLSLVVRAAGLLPGQALFESLFVMWNFPTSMTRTATLAIRATQFRTVPAYPLSLIAVPGPRMLLRLVYDQERFDATAARTLASTLRRTVQELANGGDPRLADPAS